MNKKNKSFALKLLNQLIKRIIYLFKIKNLLGNNYKLLHAVK